MDDARRSRQRGIVTGGDLARIPLGLILAFLGAMAIRKGIQVFVPDLFHILLLVGSLAIGGLFALIGLVMAFGWLAGGKARGRKPPQRRTEEAQKT